MEQKKFQALVGQLSGNEMSDREKLSLVEIMAPFNFLYCHQVSGTGGHMNSASSQRHYCVIPVSKISVWFSCTYLRDL